MKPKATDTMFEVWEAKRNVFEETKNLRGVAYFRYLRQEAVALFPNIPTHRDRVRCLPNGVVPNEDAHDRVAESGACYGVGKADRT